MNLQHFAPLDGFAMPKALQDQRAAIVSPFASDPVGSQISDFLRRSPALSQSFDKATAPIRALMAEMERMAEIRASFKPIELASAEAVRNLIPKW